MAYKIIETCIGCTACTKRCPTEAITGVRNEIHQIDPDLCICLLYTSDAADE